MFLAIRRSVRDKGAPAHGKHHLYEVILKYPKLIKEFISDRRPLRAWVPPLGDITSIGSLHIIKCLLSGLQTKGLSKKAFDSTSDSCSMSLFG